MSATVSRKEQTRARAREKYISRCNASEFFYHPTMSIGLKIRRSRRTEERERGRGTTRILKGHTKKNLNRSKGKCESLCNIIHLLISHPGFPLMTSCCALTGETRPSTATADKKRENMFENEQNSIVFLNFLANTSRQIFMVSLMIDTSIS